MARAAALVLVLSLALMPLVAMAGDNDGFCRTVDITGYAQYFIPSVENGDATGRPFVFGRDQMLLKGYAVKQIVAWVGNRYLTGLKITLSDDSVQMFGHTNGGGGTYNFQGSEVLTYWYQWKSKDGAHKIAGIEFKTSTGGHYKIKASDTSYGCNIGCDSCLVKSIGSGILAGFQGYECDPNGGGDICQLTPLIVRTVTSSEMTNMTYPTMSDAPPPVSVMLYDYPVYNNASTTSITKFTHSITEKKSLTWSVGASFKFTYMQNIKISVSGGAPAVGAVSTETTTQYTWEIGVTASVGMTYERSETYTQEFTFTCPAYTACRFAVSQGEGALGDRYGDFTAIYTVYVDSGASLPYTVTGKVATDQVSPFSQVIVTEPIPTGSGAAAALTPADHVPDDPGDGQGGPRAPDAVLRRRPGAPPVPMYVECPRVNRTQLCTRRARVPPTVVTALGRHLMMSDAAIKRAQVHLPFRPGHIVVDYAAPFDYRRGPPELRV